MTAPTLLKRFASLSASVVTWRSFSPRETLCRCGQDLAPTSTSVVLQPSSSAAGYETVDELRGARNGIQNVDERLTNTEKVTEPHIGDPGTGCKTNPIDDGNDDFIEQIKSEK